MTLTLEMMMTGTTHLKNPTTLDLHVSDRPHSYGCEIAVGSPQGQVIGRTETTWPGLQSAQELARLFAAAPKLLRIVAVLQKYLACGGVIHGSSLPFDDDGPEDETLTVAVADAMAIVRG